MTTVHSEDESAFRCDNAQQPLPTWRKRDWNGSPDAAGFRQNAHESNDIRARRLSSKRILRLQTDKIAAVAEHDFGFEWQLPEQCRTERCSRSRFANDKRAGSTHIHDIIVAQLFCEEAWAKRPVPANIDTAEENDESHTGIRKGGSPSVGKAPQCGFFLRGGRRAFAPLSVAMQDLTTGPITRHLLKTTGFMLVTMLFQTLYFLIDLYWVGRLGTAAVAAVGIAGNLTFIVLALTQMLGVGTTAVISHAVGRKDAPEAVMLFNQAQVLAMVTGALFLGVGLVTRLPYARGMAADARTAELAAQYLAWFVPAMALQFGLVAMSAALRAIGNFKTGMVVGTATVILNMLLAPFLIFGWGTGRPLGVAGAALSSLVAIVVGLVWLTAFFRKVGSFLRFDPRAWRPRTAVWKRMLGIGLPSGVEFGITTVYLALVYSITRPFGAAAQAGFGIGMRIIQAGFMPVVALAFSVAPVAGQNFGARLAQRVKDTFKDAAWMSVALMVGFAVACHMLPGPLVRVFSKDPAVIAVGTEYLRIISFNYVASGLVFVASSTFQAMGNTVPSLIASVVRIALVAIPGVIVARLPGFELSWLWLLSVASVFVQLVLAMVLLRREFALRLAWSSS